MLKNKHCSHVTTSNDLTIFNTIWKQNWAKKSYELEEFQGEATRFLIHGKDVANIGTVEIVDYNPDFTNEETLKRSSTIEDIYKFHEEPLVQANKSRIKEIDKLCILNEYSGIQSLKRVLLTLMEHAIEHDVRYYAGLINPDLLHVLCAFMKVDCIPFRDEPLFVDHAYYTMPALIDVESFYNDPKKYEKLMKVR